MMRRTSQQIQASVGPIANFVRQSRGMAGLTQEQLAQRSGVGSRFLRELELGKATLRMDRVQEVLRFFGHELVPVPLPENDR
jgi:y4mF family transcriptional regulator